MYMKLRESNPYLQNIKYDFIGQIKIDHVVNSLECFRRIVIVRGSAK